ncbi:MAG: transglycosylase SLT domain-containing protein [Nitrospirales bacterium]
MFSFFPQAPGKPFRPTNETIKLVLKDLVSCAILFSPIVLLWSSSLFPVSTPVVTEQRPTLTAPPSDLPWYDVQRFQYHVQTRLPLYQAQFEQVSKQYGFPWKLLAAQAYQESRWDRSATSPTGVRGLMMLTLDTASSLGIENRLDPQKSIEGGARYFAYLQDQVHDTIGNADRTWIALAAYNVGMGHIKDAQHLAVTMNKNPYSWNDLKTVLPLLAQKQYYQTLQYGYARGGEPVQYVKRIRAYHALLEHFLREI